MRTIGLAWACLLAAGCSQSIPTDDVRPGIYELSVEAERDACSPTRAVGSMGAVAVLVRDGAIDAPVPELADTLLTAPRVVLAGEAFHTETNRRLPGCEGAWVHEEWTLLESTGDRFDVLHRQQWQGLGACAAPMEAMPGAPEADCMSERRLRYELDELCDAPCRLVLEATGDVVCGC